MPQFKEMGLCLAPILEASWPSYFRTLKECGQRAHGANADALYGSSGSYLETLRRLAPVLHIPLPELSPEDMQKIIGYEVNEGNERYDYGWFGSIRSNGQAWHELLHNNALREFLGQLLPGIMRATAEEEALLQAREIFVRCVSLPRVGPATPTRLLAIYRPDLFFSVNRSSLRKLSNAFCIRQANLRKKRGQAELARV